VGFGSVVLAQKEKDLKIDSVQDRGFPAMGIIVSGESPLNSDVIVVVKNEEGTVFYSVKAELNKEGNWNVKFNQLMESGNYYIEASAYKNGELLSSVSWGLVKIKGSFKMIVGLFSVLVIFLLGLCLIAWYYGKATEKKRYSRIIISQRDIISSYNIFKNYVFRGVQVISDAKPETWKISEIKFILDRMSENLEKMNIYVVKGIDNIGRYDFINKLYKKIKIKIKIK